MSGTLRRVELKNRIILLLGTAHISQDSIDEVKTIIETEKPGRVCVEIDATRWKSMTEGGSWEKLDIGKVLKEGRGFFLMANLALAGFQRRMGSGIGVKPGEEMAAAIRAAEELGIPYSLCDRDVQITLKRAWAKSGLWNRSKLLASLVSSSFSNEKLTEAEIEKLKERSELEQMMEELAEFLPSVKTVLIDERDRYLAAKIMQSSEKLVVAVVGAGHLNGIETWLRRFDEAAAMGAARDPASGTVPAIAAAAAASPVAAAVAAGMNPWDVSDIDVVPAPSKWGKAAGYLIPAAIIGLIVFGFFHSGTQASLAMILRWVLLNGSLAALGSALCLAHPLTILLSFVAAPLATLNPLVGVGMFAGLSEAFLRKPTVRDLEALTEDITSVKGFYKNRVTHILLVFFLSSFGGMIGNFIALPLLASGALH
ncbi:MAG: TraB/GumN family protein [Rectinemataceae bacterium]|nr:TraB/GumN family protein [Rectinemataceae bacterium]